MKKKSDSQPQSVDEWYQQVVRNIDSEARFLIYFVPITFIVVAILAKLGIIGPIVPVK